MMESVARKLAKELRRGTFEVLIGRDAKNHERPDENGDVDKDHD